MSGMDAELSFRAQSLDNLTLDPMEAGGRRLEAEHLEERQRLMQQISQVSISATRVCSKGFVSARRRGDEFILEIPSDQTDSAGRIAPIICYGLVPTTPEISWADDVVSATLCFANRIGREVSAQEAVALSVLVKASNKTPWETLLRRISNWLRRISHWLQRKQVRSAASGSVLPNPQNPRKGR